MPITRRKLDNPAAATAPAPAIALAPRPQCAPPPLAGMRLVFINRYYYPDLSATSQMLTDLTRMLRTDGAEIHVVCARQLYDDPQARLPASEVIDGVTVHRVSTTRFGRRNLWGRSLDYLSFYASALVTLLKVTQRGTLLIAKTDPPLVSVIAAWVARWRGAVLINWLQDLFPEVAAHLGKALPTAVNRLLLSLRDQSLHIARANVVIGERMRDRLQALPRRAARIAVIENWSDEHYIQAMPVHASALRLALGLKDKLVVGYSGNLGRAHEGDTLLAAACALQDDPRIQFLMIGGGVTMQRLQHAVREQQLPNVMFLPYQPRELLADSMAAADVHLISLLPQLEGLIVPSKFYGILAAGRPTIMIGDPDGEVARRIRRYRCGEVVGVGDGAALVAALQRLQSAPDYRLMLGQRARQQFLAQHTVAEAGRRWRELLLQVAEHRVDTGGVIAGS